MRIAETLNEGLKRAYTVTIPAAELDAKIDERVDEIAPKVKMPGFRPGKVPRNLVRRMHGDALRGEALQAAVNESVQQLMSEHKLRPAMQPQVDVTSAPKDGEDLEYTVAVEVLPTIEAPAISDIALEKLVVPVSDAELDAALGRLAEQQKRFDPAAPDRAAETGDAVLIDFEGKVDGEAFEGGKGEGMRVELGSGQLIPGFEDQLVGAKANEQREIAVTFPDDYTVPYLQGRAARFEVTVNEVQTASAPAVDDALATALGIDSLEALKDILREQLGAELGQLTRTHMKRKLLDTLASRHDFPVPEAMVESEFESIWKQLDVEAGRESDPAAARAKLDAERDDYRRIAERRVRLGLLLSEIGQANDVQISQQEMNRLIGQEAAKYPGEQQKVVKFFQENAMAAAQLRAPLYEDKVVDFLLGQAAVTEREVTRDALVAEIESEDEGPSGLVIGAHEEAHVHGPDCGHDHDHDHDHGAAAEAAPPKAKRARAKKAAEPDEEAPSAESAEAS